MSTNDITGDRLVSKSPSEAYRENYDRVFGKTPTKTEDKAIVHYRPLSDETICEGYPAFIVPIDHLNPVMGQTVTNGRPARTSRVISYDKETGNFETLNTRYVLVPHD